MLAILEISWLSALGTGKAGDPTLYPTQDFLPQKRPRVLLLELKKEKWVLEGSAFRSERTGEAQMRAMAVWQLEDLR